MLLTRILTARLNRALPDNARLARHAGRLIQIRAPRFTAVWRITEDGKFALESPLLDADVRIFWRTPAEGVAVEGEAAVLNALSDWWRETDRGEMVAAVLGDTLGIPVVAAGERLRSVIEDNRDTLFATPAQARELSADIRAFQQRLDSFGARLTGLAGLANSNSI